MAEPVRALNHGETASKPRPGNLDLMVPRGIALVAHDMMKAELCEWAAFNRQTLARHRLYATGTTGGLIEERLGLSITKFRSGPLGGDQQIGSRIAEAEIDLLVFFWDPMCPQPHEPDIRALLRLAVLANIPVACNRATADFVISSPLLHRPIPYPGSEPGPAELAVQREATA